MKPLKGLPINLAALKPNPAALKGIPAVLRQPQWVAAIVSVGFHGALFAVGPSFSNMQGMALGAPGLGNPPERRVPMIELTPEEQSRLPNFDSPAYSFFPGEGLPGAFPPSNPSDLMDLFPPTSSRTPLPSLPPLPEGLSAVPRLPTRSSLGSPVTVSPFPSRLGRNPIVLPTPSEGNRANLPMIPPNLPAPAVDSPDSDPSASTPTTDQPRRPRAEDLLPPDQGAVAGNRDSVPLAAEPSAPTASPETPPSRELIARLEYSDALTTSAESSAAANDWTNRLTAALGEEPATAEETFAVEVSYDRRLCLNPEPSTGLLGFALLPGEEDGKVDISTTVLRSTGYPFLNQAAIQTLKTLAANSETPLAPGTIYQAVVTVIYDGDNCIDAATLLKSRLEASEDATPEPPAPEAKPTD